MIEKFDRDGDGQVSVSEFVKFAKGGGFGAQLAAAAAAGDAAAPSFKLGAPDYRRVFREFDRDGNGRIDRSEFRKACQDLGIDLTSSELSHVIKKFDRDGDGQVSVSEFVRFAEGGGRGSSSSPRRSRSPRHYRD